MKQGIRSVLVQCFGFKGHHSLAGCFLFVSPNHNQNPTPTYLLILIANNNNN